MSDPYVLSPCDSPILGAPPGSLHALVSGSHSIFQATIEASLVARESGMSVSFHLCDRIVTVDPASDPHQVACAWWQAQYGESWEKAVGRR